VRQDKDDPNKNQVGITDEYPEDQRRDKYGNNDFQDSNKQSIFNRFLIKCWDPYLRFLLLGAFATLCVSGVSNKKSNSGMYEALTLITTLFIISLIDAFTSKKCEDDISRLTEKLRAQKVLVVRDGKITKIKGEDLVVGDVFIIEPGMMIPADSIVIECKKT
jgi:magnesium-transporting ATPase (P-type)